MDERRVTGRPGGKRNSILRKTVHWRITNRSSRPLGLWPRGGSTPSLAVTGKYHADMSQRERLFISYSHKDKRWLACVREQLDVLEREGLIDVFEDTRIGAGEDWSERLHEEMLRAKVGLLLISAPFLTSAFIREQEIPTLFAKHEQAGMKIYPLLVRPCPWQQVKWLARLQIRPPGAKPISAMSNAVREQVLADVATEIAELVNPRQRDDGG